MKRFIHILLLAAPLALLLASCKKESRVELPVFEPEQTTLSFAGNGDVRSIALKTDSEQWTAQASESWILVSPDAGSGSATLTVTAALNPGSEKRFATVTVRDVNSPAAFVNIAIVQAPKGEERGDDPDPGNQQEEPDPEERGVVLPRSAFSGTSDWSVTGSIMNLDWNADIEMASESTYGWSAAFDVVVGEGEAFKFRKDKDWKVNLGSGDKIWLDHKISLYDDGANMQLEAGVYDLYLNPQMSIAYVLKAGDEFAHGDASSDQQEGENVRIYVLNNSTWKTPYMYAYAADGQLQPYGSWPGTYATGSKQYGDYLYTYWEASGFNGVGGINLILNDGGSNQYPAPDETDELWSNLTILQTLYFAWDGKALKAVEDPENPGVSGKGIAPEELQFGSSSWTLIGTIADSDWSYDFPMDTEGYWEVARGIEIRSSDQFKFRQNRKWDVNLGAGEYSETAANAYGIDEKIAVSSGAGNIAVKTSGTYDLYLCVENGILYIEKAGAAWTHEAEGKPDYSIGGGYDPNLDPAKKASGLTYQVNVFSFKDSDGDSYGDLNGITQSLDYFDALGVTALWLSPVQPAQSYHGYDVTDYETINPKFGTEADFERLIAEAHKHNIRIYMDYVINHSGDQNKWFLDVKDNGTASPYWNYYSLSKNPASDISAGRIAQVDVGGFDSGKWYPVTIGAGGKKHFKVELDWTSASAPKLTVSETTEPSTTSGTQNNPARYLYWGNGTYSQFYDNGNNKYVLVLDYESDWGCLVRTRNDDVWTGNSKWGFNKSGDQLQNGVAHTLYSDDNPDKVQSIVMPGGELYYYYTEFGTGMFVDFNYGPAASCASSPAFKAILQGVDKWLAMGVDGFRLDAVKHIYHNETGNNNKVFWKNFYDACNKLYKTYASARSGLSWQDDNIFMVGEVLSGDGDCTPFYTGLPALFEFQFWWDLRECLNGESIYNAGYGQTFPGSLPYRWNNHRSVRSDAIATPKLANHDEDRTASTLGNYKPKIRLAACVLLTSAGRPYIYQGEELGYWGTKAGGDEYVRTPILWTGNISSAATKGVSNKYDSSMLTPSISVESQAKDDTSLLMLYRHFAYARNINPALADGYPEADSADNNGGKVAGWYLHANNGDKVVLVLHNFSSSDQRVTRWPGENATENSILVANGKVSVSGSVASGTTVTLPPYSSVVFALN